MLRRKYLHDKSLQKNASDNMKCAYKTNKSVLNELKIETVNSNKQKPNKIFWSLNVKYPTRWEEPLFRAGYIGKSL